MPTADQANSILAAFGKGVRKDASINLSGSGSNQKAKLKIKLKKGEGVLDCPAAADIEL